MFAFLHCSIWLNMVSHANKPSCRQSRWLSWQKNKHHSGITACVFVCPFFYLSICIYAFEEHYCKALLGFCKHLDMTNELPKTTKKSIKKKKKRLKTCLLILFSLYYTVFLSFFFHLFSFFILCSFLFLLFIIIIITLLSIFLAEIIVKRKSDFKQIVWKNLIYLQSFFFPF